MQFPTNRSEEKLQSRAKDSLEYLLVPANTIVRLENLYTVM